MDVSTSVEHIVTDFGKFDFKFCNRLGNTLKWCRRMTIQSSFDACLLSQPPSPLSGVEQSVGQLIEVFWLHRSRVQQITGTTNNLQRRSGNVLPPPFDDYCHINSVSTAKPSVKNAANVSLRYILCNISPILSDHIL